MIRPSPSRLCCVQPARLRAHLEDADVGRVVDPQRRVVEPLARLEDLRPAVLGDASLAQLVAPDPRLARRRSAARARPRTSPARTARPACRGRAPRSRRCSCTSAVLPIEGRAARMIRLPGWKPPVISSRSLKPGRRAGERRCPRSERRWSLSSSSCSTSSMPAEVLLAIVVGDLEHRPLGLLDELARRRLVVAARSPGSRRWCVSRRRSSAFSRRSARSCAHVAGGRRRAGERVDRRRAADVLELAAPGAGAR